MVSIGLFLVCSGAEAKERYYYIRLDYREAHRARLNLRPGGIGMTRDFPSIDPSRKKMTSRFKALPDFKYLRKRKFLLSIAGQSLIENWFQEPSRRSITQELEDLVTGGPIPGLKAFSELLPSKANQMAIINSDEEFDSLTDRKIGVCWGVAGVLRKFLMLASFAPDEAYESRSFYLKSIDQIVNGYPIRIPGFKNLEDFSSDPVLEKYIKHKMLELWKAYESDAVYFRNLNFSRHPHLAERTLAIAMKLTERGILPKVLVTGASKRNFLVPAYKHLLLPYRSSEVEGHPIWYVWDPDFYATSVRDFPTFIIKAEPEWVSEHYPGILALPLLGIEFPQEEAREVSSMLRHLKEIR